MGWTVTHLWDGRGHRCGGLQWGQGIWGVDGAKKWWEVQQRL
jgi:hypothetical protein